MKREDKIIRHLVDEIATLFKHISAQKILLQRLAREQRKPISEVQYKNVLAKCASVEPKYRADILRRLAKRVGVTLEDQGLDLGPPGGREPGEGDPEIKPLTYSSADESSLILPISPHARALARSFNTNGLTHHDRPECPRVRGISTIIVVPPHA
jgi:hypothetical protein